MAVLLALAGALANALTSILQRSAAESAPSEMSFTWRLLSYVVRRPAWIAGMATMVAGFVLQALALRLGDLSTVQPLLTSEIVFLLVIMWAVFRLPLGWQEWLSGLAIAAGLATFLGAAQPSGGHFIPTASTWVPCALAGASAAGILIVLALRQRHGSALKAGLFGSAAAIAFAFAATIIKEESAVISEYGWAHLFETWLPYAMASVGLAGLFLAQNAFHAGSVAASQSALTIVDPITSILIGVSVFGEDIGSAGWKIALEAAGLLVMSAGVISLSRSEVVTRARFGSLPGDVAGSQAGESRAQGGAAGFEGTARGACPT
jgi:drug/metabolite transporter (DMT)-like permease